MTASIQGRLRFGLVISLVIVFAAQWLVVSLAVREVVESYVHTRLTHDAHSLVAALSFNNGRAEIDTTRVDAIYQQPFSGHYFRVGVNDTVLRSRSLWDQDLAVLPSAGTRGVISGPQNQELLAASFHFRKQGQDVAVTVAEDLTPINADIRRFTLRYGLVSLVALIALLVLQAVTVRRGLRPIDAIRRDLLQLERGEVQTLREDVPGEIQPLVRELNRLLALMSQRLERSRHASGNLAHALKTPLTVLRSLASGEDMRHRPALQHELQAQTDALQALIDRELKRARFAGGAPGQKLDVTPELESLVAALKKLYADRALRVHAALPAALTLAADREDMLELFGNVLENAFKWAASEIRIGAELGEGITICIEDDGPGVPGEDLGRLTERGLRLDERIPGHGLGLAIAQEIAATYGARLNFSRSPTLGGLRVCAIFPEGVRLQPAER